MTVKARAIRTLAALFCALLALPAAAGAGAEETEDFVSEWTVMFYMCGSDLESSHQMASQNMYEAAQCLFPQTVLEQAGAADSVPDEIAGAEDLPVNVIFQTGGSTQWHPVDDLYEVSTDCLQRWALCYDREQNRAPLGIQEAARVELASMADPETLADFIRWGRENYPAKKYCLVLWGHGEGAKRGLFYDDLYDGDILRLDELKQAMEDGGTDFETVLLDACMMANMETAWALKDHARWMVASEEIVPGSGTAIGPWITELYNHPLQDGEWLGRNICDLTSSKYADMEDGESAQTLLTWSLIDLQYIEKVVQAFDAVLSDIHAALEDHEPAKVGHFMDAVMSAETYGETSDCMRDLLQTVALTDLTTIGLDKRNNFLDAVMDAVYYNVRGSGRAKGRGLSYCFGNEMTDEELDIYARNCPSASYLSFLDVLYPSWTPPDWVYEQAERHSEHTMSRDYAFYVRKVMCSDGVPGIMFPKNTFNRDKETVFSLLKRDEEEEVTVRLGKMPCQTLESTGDEESKPIWEAAEFWWWPSIEEELLDERIISYNDSQCLCYTAMEIGSESYKLRYSWYYRRHMENAEDGEDDEQYKVHGLWEGYDSNSSASGRNVISISQKAGQKYRLLYKTDGSEGKVKRLKGEEHKLPRSLEIEEITLPEGTYYLQYEVKDLFYRPITLERIEIYWDGEQIQYPEGFSWEGESEVSWLDEH